MPFGFSRSHALLSLLVGSVVFVVAPQARAQSVLGYGEDATVAPLGSVRLRLSNDWHRSNVDGIENDTMYHIDRQFRASTIGLEIGVLRRFSVGITAPWVTTKALTFVRSQHAIFQGVVLDTILDSSHNGWGNIEAFGKVVWLGEPGQQARLAPRDGVHIRSTVVGGALLGTGITIRPSDEFAIPTSDRARAVIARSATDVTVGKHFFGSFIVRYEKPMSDDFLVGLHPGSNPFANDAVAILAQRQLGTTYEIEATPRYQLGKYFAVGVQYRYHHHAQDSFTGTTTTTVDEAPVTLDASTLDEGSELTDHRVGFGVVYSAVDAYTRNHSRIPVEVTFEYSKDVSISGNRPKESQTMLSVRLFKRLWGAEFAPPKQVTTTPTLEPSTP